jgi:hypothetical protein
MSVHNKFHVVFICSLPGPWQENFCYDKVTKPATDLNTPFLHGIQENYQTIVYLYRLYYMFNLNTF